MTANARPVRRVGFGCMRLSTEPARDDARALATLRAVLDAFAALDPSGTPSSAPTLSLDTAHAYGHDDGDLGHNERLVARALADVPALRPRIEVVTKCGMSRPGGRWEPAGRATDLRASVEGSLVALGVDALDVLLLHAPDPRVPFATSVRALARLHEEGLARRVGLSNVNVTQIREAADHLDVGAVEVALSPHDDAPLRNGVAAWCTEHGVPLFAHSPLGGPKRSARLAKHPVVASIASHRSVSSANVVLAWLRALAPVVVPIPGARGSETAGDAIRGAHLVLDDDEVDRLRAAFLARVDGVARSGPGPPSAGTRVGARSAPGSLSPNAVKAEHAAPESDDAEIVLLVGIPGAGKSSFVRSYVERGYERLNRDVAGGTLEQLRRALAERLRAGARRVVLDNTYASRAARHDVVALARAHGLPVRCVWLDTPLEDAQVNAVLRLLEKHGELPDPARLRVLAREDPHAFAPTVQHRFRRELEPPSLDEGFSHVEVVPFVRAPSERSPAAHGAVVLALDVLAGSPPDPAHVATLRDRLGAHAPDLGSTVLAIGWLPDARADLASALDAATRAHLGLPLELRVCPHGGGPPICWCRPPLPGLVLSLAHGRALDLAASTLIGTSAAHRALAAAVGMRFVAV